MKAELWVRAIALLGVIPHCVPKGFAVTSPPSPVVGVVGGWVVLRCQLVPGQAVPGMAVRWLNSRLPYDSPVHLRREGRDVEGDQSPEYRGRTSLFPEEIPRGNVSLRLRDVRVSDRGLYKCFVSTSERDEEAQVHLEVTSTGQTPVMSVKSQTANGILMVCSSGEWFPRPRVSWSGVEGLELTGESRTTVTEEGDGRLSVRTLLEISPAQGDGVSCKISNEALDGVRESRLHISGDFFPRWSAWFYGFLFMSLLALALVALGVLIYLRLNQTIKGYKQSTGLRYVQQLEDAIEEQGRKMEEVKMNWDKDIERTKQIGQAERDALCKAFDVERQNFNSERKKMNADFEKERQVAKADYKKLNIEFEQWRPLVTSEWDRIQGHSVKVSLDDSTAFSGLEVSADGLSVRGLETPRELEATPGRFDSSPYVLGLNSFASGRHYWEVDVGQKSYWDLGVARESARRRGGVRLDAREGFWVLGRSGESYEVSEPSRASVEVTGRPGLVGVMLDCEAGDVTFYDAEGMYHLFAFRAQALGTVRPFFWPGWDMSSLTIRPPSVCPSMEAATD